MPASSSAICVGELSGEILDMTYTDAAALYEAPEPTWVAAPLVEWTCV